MDVNRILSELDAEIARLQKIREALTEATGSAPVKGKRGRPKGSTNAAKTATKKTTKRKLSPEGRKRIADAMKRRWAERKGSAK